MACFSKINRFGCIFIDLLVFPLKNFLEELLPAQVMACLFFFVPDLFLDDYLGSNARMIKSWHPYDAILVH